MWQKLTLTTSNNTAFINFKGRGSIYAEGAFGSGYIGLHIVFREDKGGPQQVSSGYIDNPIDGVSIKSIDCPSGEYQLNLTGSTGATVDVFYNDQIEIVDE